MSTVRHTGYNVLGAVVPVLVTLATVPLYLRIIGLDRYGVLSICWVLVGYFGLFEFGLGPATAQHLAAVDPSEETKRERTFWAALTLSLAMGLAGAAALLLLGNLILGSIHSDAAEIADELPSAVYCLAALVPLTTSYGVLWGALQGSHRFGAMNIISSIGNVVIAVAPLAVAMAIGPNLFNLAATIVFAKLSVNIALLIYCKRAVPLTKPRLPSVSNLAKLAKFGGWVTVSSIITPILISSDKVFIGWAIGAKNVSLYMIPYNAVSKILIIPQSLSSVLFPKFAASHAGVADATEARALALLSSGLSLIVIAVMIGCKTFLTWWVGPSVSAGSWRICVVLSAGIWFNACSYIPHSKLQGTGRPDLVARVSAAQLIPYLAILYVSIRLWGTLGAAIAWSFRVAVEMLFFFAVIGRMKSLLTVVWQPAILVIASALLAISAPVAGYISLAGLAFTSVGACIVSAVQWAGQFQVIGERFSARTSDEMEQN